MDIYLLYPSEQAQREKKKERKRLREKEGDVSFFTKPFRAGRKKKRERERERERERGVEMDLYLPNPFAQPHTHSCKHTHRVSE